MKLRAPLEVKLQDVFSVKEDLRKMAFTVQVNEDINV